MFTISSARACAIYMSPALFTALYCTAVELGGMATQFLLSVAVAFCLLASSGAQIDDRRELFASYWNVSCGGQLDSQ